MERDSHERVKTLLKDTITLLCKNGIDFRHKFSIEALIGITVDDNKVVLMSINELVRTNEDQNNDNDSDLSDDTSTQPDPTPTAYTAPNRRVKKTPKRKITNDDDEELPEDIIDFKKFRNTEFIKEEQDDWAYPDALQHEVVKTPDGSSYLITKQPELEDSWLQPPPDNPGDPLVQEMLGGGVPTDPGEGTSGQAEGPIPWPHVQATTMQQTTNVTKSKRRFKKSRKWSLYGEKILAFRQRPDYRQWSVEGMAAALKGVMSEGLSQYSMAKRYNIPVSTLHMKIQQLRKQQLEQKQQEQAAQEQQGQKLTEQEQLELQQQEEQ